MEYRNRKLFYASACAFDLRQLHYPTAAVVDAPVGGPTVSRAGQNCPYYQTKPDLTTSGQLSAQKPRHSLGTYNPDAQARRPPDQSESANLSNARENPLNMRDKTQSEERVFWLFYKRLKSSEISSPKP